MTTRDRAMQGNRLTPLNAWALSFGCIIGWGAFVMPGTTFLPQAGPFGTLIAMLIGVGMMLLLGFNYSSMMSCLPGIAGPYGYAKVAFGRGHAFLCAWLLCFCYLVIIPCNASTLSTMARLLFRDALSFGFRYRVAGSTVCFGEVLFAQLTLLLLGTLSALSRDWMRKIQTVLAIVTVSAVFLVLVAALTQGRLGRAAPMFGMGGRSGGSAGILTVVLLTPWAFVGFDTLSFSTGEFRFPVKRSFRVISLSILFGGCTYAALSWLAACVIPPGYSNWQPYLRALAMYAGVESMPTFYAAKSLLGGTGVTLMSLAALSAILTGIIGFYRAAGQLIASMAEDGIFPDRFRRVPHAAMLVTAVAVLAAFLGSSALYQIVNASALGAVVGFGYTSAATWKIARAGAREDRCTTGIAGLCVSALLAVLLLAPGGNLRGIPRLPVAAWCALGLPLCLRARRLGQPENGGKGFAAAGAALTGLCVFCGAMWLLRDLQ